MAENKKSIIAYTDWGETFDSLTDEQAGKLAKHLFDYVRDKDPISDDPIVKIAFIHIEQTLKRDLKKYERRAENSRINGKKGGRPPEEKKPNKPNGLNDNPDEPRKPDSVSVSVSDSVNGSVSVNDNVNVNEITNKPIVKNRYAQDVIDCVKNCLEHFDGHLHPKTPKQKLQWCEVVEKLNRIDGIPYEQIEAITEWARKDEFWASNFLALPKLRKKNKDGLLWILVFSEKLKRNDNNKPLTEQQQQIANSRSVQNIIDRRKEDRRRAQLSNDSPTD